MQGQQGVGASLREQGLIGNRAGGNDTLDPALDRPLAQRRVPHLFANRNRLTLPDQTGQITVGGMTGHARHRDRLAGGFAALGQGNIQQAGGLAGVFIKQLIEVAHLEKKQHIGIFGLETEILPHNRADLSRGAGFRSHARHIIKMPVPAPLPAGHGARNMPPRNQSLGSDAGD